MNISIIIPNYNGAELLKKNVPYVLSSFKNFTQGHIELIVADDASTDDSSEVITKLFSQIQQKNISTKLVTNANREQGGFSKNVNRGIAVATGDVVILLNSDVRPYKNFWKPLLAHFSNKKIFAVGCMDESIEDGKVVLRGRGIGHWEKGFLVHSKGEVTKINTLWVSGGSGAFSKSIWDKIGGLYDIYNPFYWEDIDLSYRAQKDGFIVIFEPKSRVVHEHAKGTIQTNFKHQTVQKTVYRNQFLFVWLNATDFTIVLDHIIHIPFYLLAACIDRNSALISGFCSALFLMLKVLKLRRKNKQLFIKTDKEIEIID